VTPTPFGPQLIGETEKTLNDLLRRTLDGRLTESQWVTLRVAGQYAEKIRNDDDLAALVADRARLDDASALVAGLADDGLLADGHLTEEGRSLVSDLQARLSARVAPLWEGWPPEDVVATARVLNELRDRARALLV
jgi:hypothetical protein